MAKLYKHNPFQLKLTQLVFSLHYYCHHDLQCYYHSPHHGQRHHNHHNHHYKSIIFITTVIASSSSLQLSEPHIQIVIVIIITVSPSSLSEHHCQNIIAIIARTSLQVHRQKVLRTKGLTTNRQNVLFINFIVTTIIIFFCII